MHKTRKGFTFIELMIAIAIIGIIVSVAVPAITNIYHKHLTHTIEAQGNPDQEDR